MIVLNSRHGYVAPALARDVTSEDDWTDTRYSSSWPDVREEMELLMGVFPCGYYGYVVLYCNDYQAMSLVHIVRDLAHGNVYEVTPELVSGMDMVHRWAGDQQADTVET